jgi:hypothetical protein
MFNPNIPNQPDNNIGLNQSELLDQIVGMFNSDVFISGVNDHLQISTIDNNKYQLTFKNNEANELKQTEGDFETIIGLLAKIKSELYQNQAMSYGDTLVSLTPEMRSIFSDKLEVKSDQLSENGPTYKLKWSNKIILENYSESELVKVLNNLIYIFNNK